MRKPRTPCPECGAKGGFHFKHCSKYKPRQKKIMDQPEQQAIETQQVTDQVVEPEVKVAPGPVRRICPYCLVDLLRASCGGVTVCIHGIPLTDECKKCHKMHHGNVIWRCPKCGYNTSSRPLSILNSMPMIDGKFITEQDLQEAHEAQKQT